MRDGLEIALRGRENQCIVIVAHGGILAATIQNLCPDVSLAGLETLHIGNCAITEITFDRCDGQLSGTMCGWALCSHLT